MDQVIVNVRTQGGRIREGFAVGRMGSQLLVRYGLGPRTEYGRFDDGIRERWFPKSRWTLVEGDPATLPRFKRATCAPIRWEATAADALPYTPDPRGSHYGGTRDAENRVADAHGGSACPCGAVRGMESVRYEIAEGGAPGREMEEIRKAGELLPRYVKLESGAHVEARLDGTPVRSEWYATGWKGHSEIVRA